MISTNDFRIGLTIELDGEIYSVVDFQHVKPGKGSAFVRSKLKNVKTGFTVERTFRAGEKVRSPCRGTVRCSICISTRTISSWILLHMNDRSTDETLGDSKKA